MFRRADDPRCKYGCQAEKENPPEFVEEACSSCVWSQEIPEIEAELIRRYQLMRIGMTIPIGQLTRWEEEALLIIHEEFLERQKPSPPSPPPLPRNPAS